MARKARPVEYDYVDDLDGKVLPEGTETTKFSVGGTRYEIDLSAANVKKLEKALGDIQTFIDAARVAGATPGRRPSARGAKSAGSRRNDLAEVRTWAKDNGYEVSERGRISAAVLQAYDAAH